MPDLHSSIVSAIYSFSFILLVDEALVDLSKIVPSVLLTATVCFFALSYLYFLPFP